MITDSHIAPVAASRFDPVAPGLPTAWQRWRSILKSVVSTTSGRVGVSLLTFHIALALLAPVIAVQSPIEIDPVNNLQAPSWDHPFGTDRYGRDILSRVMYGGRVALLVCLLATAIAEIGGGLLGLGVGYAGGRFDEICARIIDAFLAVPGLLMLLLCVTIFGGGLGVLIPTIGLLGIPGVARIARAAALDLIGRDFITAAKARGEHSLSIVRRELAPNALDVMLVDTAMRASWTVVSVAGLSFLGFGANPPTADWGLMIAENRAILMISPWGTIFPILAIGLLVLGLNLTADALAKALGIDRTREVVR